MSWISVLALIPTILIAIFTCLTWRIYKRFYSDDYQQDLIWDIHDKTEDIRREVCRPEVCPFDKIFGIECTFINPGKVPMIIENVEIDPPPCKERIGPPNRPWGIFISSFPWVIGGGNFAIYWAYFDSKKEFKVTISYRIHKGNKYCKLLYESLRCRWKHDKQSDFRSLVCTSISNTNT